MTLLGKIFTVLIFIMSLVFMSFAVLTYATHKNWKTVVMNPGTQESGHDAAYDVGFKRQIEDMRRQIAIHHERRDSAKNELAFERAARRKAIAELQSQLAVALQQRDDANKALNVEKAAATTRLAQLEQAQMALAAQVTENQKLKEDNKTARAERDKELLHVIALTDTINANEGTIKNLGEIRNQLAQQVADRKKVMREFGLTVNSVTERIPPKIEGYVSGVSAKAKDFIEISLGTDDGLRRGHSLEIGRGPYHVASAIVYKIDTNYAVARVVSQKRPILKNDNVKTTASQIQ